MTEDYFAFESGSIDITNIFDLHELLPKYMFPVIVGKQVFHYYAVGNDVFVEILDEKNMQTLNGFSVK